jgi:hypothetical protein
MGTIIKLELKEVACEDVNLIHLAQDEVYYVTFVNTVLNLRVP